ncbi:DoxX family membrane protein [bacterium]|nr:DoxX family membrane protein [bacterium]
MTCQQKTQNSKSVNVRLFVLRVILGCIFIYSALWKIQNPQEFLNVVMQYQMVPGAIVGSVAVIVPWVEITCGFLLIFDLFVPYAIYLLIVSLCVFTGAQLTALCKGLSIDCGCFPVLGYAPKVGWLTLLRNVVLLAMCVGAMGQIAKKDPKQFISAFGWKQKVLLVGLTLACIVSILFACTYKRDTVFHYPDYAKQYSSNLMRDAVSKHKEVVLVFVSGTCNYCYSLFDGPMKNSRLAGKMRNVQCLVVNKSLVPRRLIKSYDVHIYPSLVFINKYGDVERELVGYHKTNDIIKSLDATKHSSHTVAELTSE